MTQGHPKLKVHKTALNYLCTWFNINILILLRFRIICIAAKYDSYILEVNVIFNIDEFIHLMFQNNLLYYRKEDRAIQLEICVS